MPRLPIEPEQRVWSVPDLEGLPDDGTRRELLHGALVPMTPGSFAHQGIALRLATSLREWCTTVSLQWTVLSPGGVYVSSTTWLEPDVAVYPIDEYSRASWQEVPVPLLVAEVLSPSTGSHDRFRKRPIYLAHGVPELWLIDPDVRQVERWSPRSEFPVIEREGVTWQPHGDLPPWHVAVDALLGPPR